MNELTIDIGKNISQEMDATSLPMIQWIVYFPIVKGIGLEISYKVCFLVIIVVFTFCQLFSLSVSFCLSLLASDLE